jgi:LPS O-antigen subunit length determinant protein (WzzB/FepE family)
VQNSNNPQPTQGEVEISLLDILRFLKNAYKTILVFSVLGIAAAIIYLTITPKQYEATAQIAMAQIVANNNLNPPAVNIEEPTLLIARLSAPTSFDPKTINACGMQGNPDAGATLAKGIKLAPAKGIANVVELKTVGASPEATLSCASAVFELIKTTQTQLSAPYIDRVKLRMADDKERLEKAKELLSKADKSGSTMSVVYLSTRDEIRFLLDEITALKNVVASNESQVTRLVAPIYASDVPIAPKKRMVLAAGLFGGLFLGLLIALARQLVLKLKGVAGGLL